MASSQPQGFLNAKHQVPLAKMIGESLALIKCRPFTWFNALGTWPSLNAKEQTWQSSLATAISGSIPLSVT
jgi:hypothetical protein